MRMCPALSKRVKILASQKRIIYQPTNSFYQVLSAEAYSKHGFNIHGVVFDELHTQPNRKLFDVMTKGSGDARMQPLYFLITTAGTDTNSICYETHQKAKDILEGRKIDPTFYPVIYGADESDDWTDPKVWKMLWMPAVFFMRNRRPGLTAKSCMKSCMCLRCRQGRKAQGRTDKEMEGAGYVCEEE